MRSEAQKKADKAYAKKLRQIPLNFNRDDPEDNRLLEQLDKQENMTAYMKDLISRDIAHRIAMSEHDAKCEQLGLTN